MQDAGVMACTKHYIGNEQEHFRQGPEAQSYGFNITQSVSANIDDKTMHELYLWYGARLLDCSALSNVDQAICRCRPSWDSFHNVLIQPSQQFLRLFKLILAELSPQERAGFPRLRHK
jgi:hypothetical protein